MANATSVLQLRGLGKRKMEAVVERARRLGMTPQAYLKRLVEDDLAISERAKKLPLKELLGPGEQVDESEIDRLVEMARNEYHNSNRRIRPLTSFRSRLINPWRLAPIRNRCPLL